MLIKEQRVFNYIFPYLGNMEMGFAVVANSQEEGAHMLQKWMTTVVAELAVQFPAGKAPNPTSIASPQEFVALNDLQRGHIDRLISEISKYRQPEATAEETVKKWVDVDLTPLSFVGVCQLLETMKREYVEGIQVIDSTEEHGEIVTQTPSVELEQPKSKKK